MALDTNEKILVDDKILTYSLYFCTKKAVVKKNISLDFAIISPTFKYFSLILYFSSKGASEHNYSDLITRCNPLVYIVL